MNEHTNLLEIKDLTVHYVTVDGTVHAVENLNLTLPEGKTLGLVGETGAGKTTTVKAIMQILPDPPAKILTGEVIFCGEDLLKKNKKSMRKIRGKQISMIFQDPMTSLNPVITGFREVMGSWKIMEICFPRIFLMDFLFFFRRSSPQKITSPVRIFAGGSGRICMIALTVVVFPAPVSPTSPRVFPSGRVRFRFSTAWTVPSTVT